MKSSVSWSRLVATSPPIHPGIESGFRGSDGRAARASSASRPRESVHASTLHRLSTQRRLCGIHRRRRFVLFSSSREYDDVHAAPLLCAGLIGYRAYRLTGPALRLGIYGFARPRTSSRRSHALRAVTCLRLSRLAIIRRWGLRAMLGITWAGFSNQRRPVRSTQRSSSPRLAPSCPKRCHASLPVGSLCAPAST